MWGGEELEILIDQAVGEAGGDADLVNGEGLLVQQGNSGEVLEITIDGALGVLGTALNIGELVAGEVEL